MLLEPLLRPRSIAVFGGEWADEVVRQSLRTGFTGDLWRVHPGGRTVGDVPCFSNVEALPYAPDVAFVALKPRLAIDVTASLRDFGCGAVVLFASGFDELGHGGELTEELLEAAGEMPLLGPNCYGMLNYFDGVALWPDQQSAQSHTRGVAIISQSGNLAINVTFQARGLALGYVITVGNQASLGVEDLLHALLHDSRVSAVGIYLEGVRNGPALHAAGLLARKRRIPIVVMKAGKTESSRETALSHTASLVGDDRVFDAFCARYGWARVNTPAQFVETLKLLHVHGALSGPAIASMSCSGGEAALVADLSVPLGLELPNLSNAQATVLREVLGPGVHITNPLDYHTYIWGDEAALRRVFETVLNGQFDAVVLLLDFPDPQAYDLTQWWPVAGAIEAAARSCRTPFIVISNLSESMPAVLRERLLSAGVAPLQGLDEGLSAVANAAKIGGQRRVEAPATANLDTLPRPEGTGEAAVKQWLFECGVQTPCGREISAAPSEAIAYALELGFPVVVKTAAPMAHKSDGGGVWLDICDVSGLTSAATALAKLHPKLLIEKCVGNTVVELLVSIRRDPVFGHCLTLGAGGVLVELVAKTEVALLPCSEREVEAMLRRLPMWRLMTGYRGRASGDVSATVNNIVLISRAACAAGDMLEELEINPLAVLPQGEGTIVLDAKLKLTIHPVS